MTASSIWCWRRGGENRVEREGLASATLSAAADRHLQPGGGQRSRHLLDRFAIALSANQLVSNEQQVEITNAVISHGQCSRSFAEKWGEETDALATQLLLPASGRMCRSVVSRSNTRHRSHPRRRGGTLRALRGAGGQGPCLPQWKDRVEADDLQVAVAP